MKCRRNNTSRGSGLRGSGSAATRPTPVSSAPGRQEHTLLGTAATASVSVLRIDGHTEGSIQYAGAVAVGPNGHVIGDIYAAEIFVVGSVSGNVCATRTLRVAASGKIVGDMQSPRVAVARGAQLHGAIATRGGLSAPSNLDDSAVDALLSGGHVA